ncbi:hypothetical protein V1521DRAFT_467525 [Lipomyces starkeyi]
MKRILNVYTISAFVALGGALFEFDIGSVADVLGTAQYNKFYGYPLGTRQSGIPMGALSSGFLGTDCLNFQIIAKVAVQLGAIMWCIGAIVQSLCNGVAMLIARRALARLCISITSSLVPIYQPEIAPRRIPDALSRSKYSPIPAAFRIPWVVQAVPAVILIFGLFWAPHWPRWLASKDRWEGTLQVLAFLRSAENDINDPLVLPEYKVIENQVWLEHEEETNPFRELFSQKIRKRVSLAMDIQMWSQEWYERDGVLYRVRFQSAMIPNLKLVASIKYIINMVMTIPPMIWTDRWGRRPSLLIEPSWPVVSHRWYFCGDLGPEIVQVRVRAKSASLSTASNCVTNFALGFAIRPCCAPSVGTKRRTLEEMDEIFEQVAAVELDRLARDIEIG